MYMYIQCTMCTVQLLSTLPSFSISTLVSPYSFLSFLPLISSFSVIFCLLSPTFLLPLPLSPLFTRLRAVSLGAHNEVTFREDTGILRLSLAQDQVGFGGRKRNILSSHLVSSLCTFCSSSPHMQEYPLLKLGNNFSFPLYISVNMALTSAEDYTQTRTTNSA